MEGFIYLMLLLGVYMLPTIIAVSRHQKNVGAICALNILLGWSIIGWIVSFVWALTNNRDEKYVNGSEYGLRKAKNTSKK